MKRNLRLSDKHDPHRQTNSPDFRPQSQEFPHCINGRKFKLGAFFLLRLDFGLELRLKLRLDFSFQISFGLLGSFLSRQRGSRLLSSQFFGLRLFASPALSAFLNSRSALVIFTGCLRHRVVL